MSTLSHVIIVEGDTGIARFWFGRCGQNFRARLDSVTQVDKQPICEACIDWANPQRAALGFQPIPIIRSAYHPGDGGGA
jgi:hypothetical protein